MKHRSLFLIILLFIISCNSNQKTIVISNSNGIDSIKDFIRDSLVNKYYPNGRIEVQSVFRDEKQNGIVKYFDSTGILVREEFYYYGIMTGSVINYKKGEPSEYIFTSLETKPIFYLNYDSILGKDIEKVEKNFFFYNIQETGNIFTKKYSETECSLYLLDPPNFRFSYSLCIIKPNFEVVKELQQFDNSKVWTIFHFNKTELDSNENFAIKLRIDDDINKRSTVMFKKLIID